MGRIVCLVLPLVVWSVLLSGCGGEGEPPATSYVILDADTSALPPDVEADYAMEDMETIMRRRAEEFGAEVRDIQRQGTNRVALELSGITAEEARDLMGRTAMLEFKEPQRDEEGNFVCIGETGESFTVPSDLTGTGDVARPVNLVPTVDTHQWLCVPSGQTQPTGNVMWVPATGIGSDGKEKALTGHFLKANASVEMMVAEPVVAIDFNSEGADLFEQITSRLVGLPLGIFLDEEIISAPTIMAAISGGRAVIAGVAVEEGRILVIQLNSGALPIPVRVVAVGEGPLP